MRGSLIFLRLLPCLILFFYETMKEHTGIGFAPYLYHAAQYNFTDYFGIEGGLLLSGLLVMSVQWRF